jgi:hypothetical protein
MSDYEISESDALECKDWVYKLYKSYITDEDRSKVDWQHNLTEAEKALDVLDEKLESGTMGDDRYRKRAELHKMNIIKFSKLINGNEQNAKNWLELSNGLFSGAVNLGNVFEVANTAERRQLTNYAGSNWYLGNKKVTFTPRKPYDLLAKRDKYSDWRARPDLNRRSPP